MRSVLRGAAPLLAALALASTTHADPTPPAPDGPTLPAPAAPPRAVPIVPASLASAAAARSPAPSPKAAAAPHPWPAAFAARKPPEPAAVQQASYVAVETRAVPLTVAAPPAEDPAAAAEVRRRLRLLYDGAPATVTLEPQPDGSVLVHVRVHEAEGGEKQDGAAPPAVPKLRVLVEADR